MTRNFGRKHQAKQYTFVSHAFTPWFRIGRHLDLRTDHRSEANIRLPSKLDFTAQRKRDGVRSTPVSISFMLRAHHFRRSEAIRDNRYDDERIAYEREYLKKADHGDSVTRHRSALDRISCINATCCFLVRIVAGQETHDAQRHQNASGRVTETSAAQRRSGHQSIDHASVVRLRQRG